MQGAKLGNNMEMQDMLYDIVYIYAFKMYTEKIVFLVFQGEACPAYTKHHHSRKHPPAMPIGDHQNSHKALVKGKLLADGWQPRNLSNFNFHETHLRTTIKDDHMLR